MMNYIRKELSGAMDSIEEALYYEDNRDYMEVKIEQQLVHLNNLLQVVDKAIEEESKVRTFVNKDINKDMIKRFEEDLKNLSILNLNSLNILIEADALARPSEEMMVSYMREAYFNCMIEYSGGDEIDNVELIEVIKEFKNVVNVLDLKDEDLNEDIRAAYEILLNVNKILLNHKLEKIENELKELNAKIVDSSTVRLILL